MEYPSCSCLKLLSGKKLNTGLKHFSSGPGLEKVWTTELHLMHISAFVFQAINHYVSTDKLTKALKKIKQKDTVFWLANLTIHFSVGLPFVVPASEGLAVVLSTLLGAEVQRLNGARPSVAKLVETAGAWAKFAIVLWPMTWQEKKTIYREKKYKYCFDLFCEYTFIDVSTN